MISTRLIPISEFNPTGEAMHLVRAWRIRFTDGAVRYKATFRIDARYGGSWTPEATIDPIDGVEYTETIEAPFPLGDLG